MSARSPVELAPPVRAALRLICTSVEELIESHRWTRKLDHSGVLWCLDCRTEIVWDPTVHPEPVVPKLVRCPGVHLIETVPPTTRPPFGLAIPCSAGHDSDQRCMYCTPIGERVRTPTPIT
jgi:hypothetical protein